MSKEHMYIGEIIDPSMKQRVGVFAWCEDGMLWLSRELVDNPSGADNPCTIVTREGLLRLAQGPFEHGYVEDHL